MKLYIHTKFHEVIEHKKNFKGPKFHKKEGGVTVLYLCALSADALQDSYRNRRIKFQNFSRTFYIFSRIQFS